MDKKIIGKKEFISLPHLGLINIEAKIDTGAYTSALHCKDIRIQNNMVYFIPLDEKHENFNNKELSFALLEQKKVKSSNGARELRAYIETTACFFDKKYTIILSLTDRSSMKYPILIGRKFLQERFIVDVSRQYLSKRKEI